MNTQMFQVLKSYIETRKKIELEAFQAKMAELEKEEACITAFCTMFQDASKPSVEIVEEVPAVDATTKVKKAKKVKSKKPKEPTSTVEASPDTEIKGESIVGDIIQTSMPPLPSSLTVQKEPSEYKRFCSSVSVLIKEALDSAKAPLGFYTKVSGYMYSSGLKDNLTVESVKEAIKYLNDHPEHVSKTKQKTQKN